VAGNFDDYFLTDWIELRVCPCFTNSINLVGGAMHIALVKVSSGNELQTTRAPNEYPTKVRGKFPYFC